ncbi:MAG: PD-(D/E)XK nuclease family protein [Lachnospiraceae bacterium]|nr:PD-(D/E)XK nuclease family protein [Lachnospiraceae bacterium]
MEDKLRFVLGPSFSGKTRFIYDEIIEQSERYPDKNLLLIVPDQYTLSSQIEMVKAHPKHVITNIDVLSFGRLSHRILEETGRDRAEMIDDTGKSLIIRREAGAHLEDIPVLGKYLRRPGYIHEIKSVISEFMLYGVGTADLERAAENMSLPPGLRNRLSELSFVYDRFTTALGTTYTTREDRLLVLADAVRSSGILKGSRIYFDGFTGFTPLQVNVIREMAEIAENVTVTLLWDHNNKDTSAEETPEALFHMSRQTIDALTEAAGGKGVSFVFSEDIPAKTGDRVEKDEAVLCLEKNLFRKERTISETAGKTDSIRIYRYRDQRSEVEGCAREIIRYIRDTEAKYSDIAVIAGDLAGYAGEIEDVFKAYDIPVYMDYTRNVSNNALSVFIRSALEMMDNAFRPDSVMRFLRTGFVTDETDIPGSSLYIDQFENYIRRRGLRGISSYEKPFSEEETPEEKVRQKLMDVLSPLKASGKTVRDRIHAVYELMLKAGCAEKLYRRSEELKEEGEYQLSGEYGQIYRYILNLLDVFISLLGDEEVENSEFTGLFEAGIAEIRVGTIPQDRDRVTVGDLERTRLDRVQAVFVLGCDDMNIPGRSGQGSLLSEVDREMLSACGLTLSPSGQEIMFSQRMYLYMNLTKACRLLYISWPGMGADMSVRNPSYLTGEIRRIFPGIRVREADSLAYYEKIVSPRDAYSLLAVSLRRVAEGEGKEMIPAARAVLSAVKENSVKSGEGSEKAAASIKLCDRMLGTAFSFYEGKSISKSTVEALYGKKLRESVTRIETFAQCPYRYFLGFGLGLKERRDYSVTSLDTGIFLHDALERFGEIAAVNNKGWADLTEPQMQEYARAATDEVARKYKDTPLGAAGRNRYMQQRLYRILMRSVSVIGHQIAGGGFKPVAYEAEFKDLLEPGDGFSINLNGKIDRIDRAVLDGISYYRVIDYKTGSKKYNEKRISAGLDVQLPLYLKYVVDDAISRKENARAAGMFYYHVADPLLKSDSGLMTASETEDAMRKELRLNGAVVAETDVVSLMDRYGGDSIIPSVFRKGTTDPKKTAANTNITRDEMDDLLKSARNSVVNTGRSIISGRIEASPVREGSENACTYCPYRMSCIFDERLPGFRSRKIEIQEDTGE